MGFIISTKILNNDDGIRVTTYKCSSVVAALCLQSFQLQVSRGFLLGKLARELPVKESYYIKVKLNPAVLYNLYLY
jgi:hypothetical protein